MQLARFAPGGRPDFTLELESGARVGTVTAGLGLGPATPRITAVNGRQVGPDHRLGENDHLLIVPPVAGG